MVMALPRDIPTLCAFRTKNHTRPDNVFCSPSLLPAYISCTTDLERMPPKTDHYLILQVLELQHPVVEHVLALVYCGMDWSEYRKHLLRALMGVERHEKCDTVESVEAAIRAVEEAVWTTTKEVVDFSKPSPHIKRWFTPEMATLRDATACLECYAYKQRLLPDHPVHEQAQKAVRAYCKAVKEGKARHWVEWQEKLLDGQV
ncbi:hypothetical protein DFH08DRAFT_818752 [Mycena albidolilacea]|uniref:Uncharacterized protein n=1 Tax=Mycena albidolilacea TaxID=1033008 RepID=A0AAD6ZG54_9AGAR|nr:hypothetical protein DFH08DRAFT_818752 [Mycena albidolilacea]